MSINNLMMIGIQKTSTLLSQFTVLKYFTRRRWVNLKCGLMQMF